MMYYNNTTGRIIESDEMVRMYGTDKAIPELGIYELTYQPDFVPFAFNPVNNGTYFPVQSNARVEIQRLVKAGYTEAEAEELLG
jgi:hypothetical protein